MQTGLLSLSNASTATTTTFLTVTAATTAIADGEICSSHRRRSSSCEPLLRLPRCGDGSITLRNGGLAIADGDLDVTHGGRGLTVTYRSISHRRGGLRIAHWGELARRWVLGSSISLRRLLGDDCCS